MATRHPAARTSPWRTEGEGVCRTGRGHAPRALGARWRAARRRPQVLLDSCVGGSTGVDTGQVRAWIYAW
jgi:hypothetical protein